MLAMLDLGAVEIEGIGAIHSDLKNRLLYQVSSGEFSFKSEVLRMSQAGHTPSPAATISKPEYAPPAKGWHGVEKLP